MPARRYGAYDVDTWAPFGVVLLFAVVALLSLGRRVSGAAAAATVSLVALAVLMLLSPLWGGVPDEAWRNADTTLIAASSFLLGSAAASRRGRAIVFWGVLGGVVAVAAELLARVAYDGAASLFLGRVLNGLVGYHNGQAALFALALPLGLWATSATAAPARFAGGFAAVLCSAALLLTQSRAGAGAAVVAVGVQLAVTRSRRLAAATAVLGLSVAVLALELRAVDLALFEADPAGRLAALRKFVALGAALAVAAGAWFALAARLLPRRRPLLVRAAAAAAVVALAVTGAAAAEGLGASVRSVVSGIGSDAPPLPAAGSTRFASMTLNGRREAWRVAGTMIAESPVLGTGSGTFARAWMERRRLEGLSLRQPHSLELELLSELGVGALALFAAFVGFAALPLGRLRTPEAAVGLALLAAVLVQASLDWTWSFPALTAPALAVAGVAGRGGMRGDVSPGRLSAVVAASLVAAAALLVPYLAGRDLSTAVAAEAAGRIDQADRAVRASLRLNPWSGDARALEARLAEGRGDYLRAATLYRRAAGVSRDPWLDRFREARALRAAGDDAGAVRACRLAARQNPLEPALRAGPCG